MLDPIATFPLRNASVDELSDALAYSFGEFNAWNGQALTVCRFPQQAMNAGVDVVLREELSQAMKLMSEQGLIKEGVAYDQQAVIEQAVQRQATLAVHGAKTAAIVMLHNACERVLWRLVRLGLVLNRETASRNVSGRKCNLGELAEHDKDALIDREIEKWWEQLERESMVKKWNTLAELVGFPDNFNSPPQWYFDRNMLEDFDNVRINAVHHDGRDVAEFDFPTFSEQLTRALMKWVTYIGLRFRLQMRPEAFLGIQKSG